MTCECCGNWKQILKEYKPLIGKEYIDDKGVVYVFFGLVNEDDDYSYGMHTKEEPHKLELLSCVGSIEDFGYVRRI